MKRIIKRLVTKTKCQQEKNSGGKCSQVASMIVMDRELSSIASKKLCKLHAFPVLLEHCLEMQEYNKELEARVNLLETKKVGSDESKVNQEEIDFLLDQCPGVIQKIHDKVW